MHPRRAWIWLFPREASRVETALRAVALIVFLVLLVHTWSAAVAGSYDFDGFHREARFLASLPLTVIWHATTAIIGALGLLGLAVVVRARRHGADREAWFVVTSLCALGILFVSPIVWTHYFLWALPAIVALRARTRTLIAWGLFSLACQLWRPALGVGAHVWLSIALYVTVALGYLRAGTSATP